MKFSVGNDIITVQPAACVIAGFTGRDEQQTERHIAELRDAGVPVPDRVPAFFAVPPSVLAQQQAVTVTHHATSGEAEIALVIAGPTTYVTLASDHTDRDAETRDMALSKAVCPKIVAGNAWPLAEVRDRWDELELRSWITEDGERVLYQEGTAGQLLPPHDLLGRIPFTQRPADFVLLTGTLPAIGGIRHAEEFTAELRDPATGRTIELSYTMDVLDVLGPV